MTSELPIGKGYTPEELGERFVAVEDTPFDQHQLGYRMMVPKDWKADRITAETASLNAVHLKPLGIFFGEPDGGSPPYIQVQAVLLPKSITAASWLRWLALATERRIEHLVEVSRLFADALVTFEIDGLAFTGRAAARIDRNRAFLVFAFVPTAVYETYAEAFGVAVASFKLLDTDPAATIEPHRSLDGPGRLHALYPASWKPRVAEGAPAGKEALDLYNLDDNGNLNGLIRLKAVSKTLREDRDGLVRGLLEELAGIGLALGSRVHQATMPVQGSGFYNGAYQIFAAQVAETGLPQEVWVTTFEDAHHHYAVLLLTPAKEEIFYVWAINHRAYQIVLEGLG